MKQKAITHSISILSGFCCHTVAMNYMSPMESALLCLQYANRQCFSIPLHESVPFCMIIHPHKEGVGHSGGVSSALTHGSKLVHILFCRADVKLFCLVNIVSRILIICILPQTWTVRFFVAILLPTVFRPSRSIHLALYISSLVRI